MYNSSFVLFSFSFSFSFSFFCSFTTGSIGNVRIRQNIGVGFSVNDDNTYDNLEELMTAVQVPLNLVTPCASSPFLELFGGQEQEIIGYQLMG